MQLSAAPAAKVMMLYAYGVKKVYGIKGGFKGNNRGDGTYEYHIRDGNIDTGGVQ